LARWLGERSVTTFYAEGAVEFDEPPTIEIELLM
jgi:hypothetical protein